MSDEILPGHRWTEDKHTFMIAMINSELLDFPFVVVNLTSGLIEPEHYPSIDDLIEARLPDDEV